MGTFFLFKLEKATGKNIKHLQTAHVRKPWDPKMIWCDCIYTVDTWLCPCTRGVHANALSSVATGNILAKNRHELHLFFGLWLCQTSCVDPFFVIFMGCSSLNTSPHLPQLSRRKLQCCFAAKRQKCFVDYKMPPACPLASGWEAHDWIFIFRSLCPLISSSMKATVFF